MKTVIDITPYLSCPRPVERCAFSWDAVGAAAIRLLQALFTLAVGVCIVAACAVFCLM